MPSFGPIKRSDLIHYLRELGFKGPYRGGNHQYMVKGEIKLTIPNPHHGDIDRDLLARILRQGGIDRDEWERL
ncbi:MAG: type II toxin-antitoxin system HicA family toxin [Candidatus Latescibacteria bacterium]|nr:type II toxin-antitoxin system HicA family toxin [Candidatus Latescibacterota bacterium]